MESDKNNDAYAYFIGYIGKKGWFRSAANNFAFDTVDSYIGRNIAGWLLKMVIFGINN